MICNQNSVKIGSFQFFADGEKLYEMNILHLRKDNHTKLRPLDHPSFFNNSKSNQIDFESKI